jgi:hypothetical protein
MDNVLSNILPSELMARGIYLEKYVGFLEYAWKYDDAKSVLVYLVNNKYIILGGDVLIKQGNKISSDTPDYWEYSEDLQKNRDENIKASYEKATKYLDWFHANYGDDYVYTIVFDEYITKTKGNSEQ